jgi:NOL1/NOP2/sun family putative RNA methylase
MSEHLPAAFVDKMKAMLQDEFPAFLASYVDSRYYGLRVNTLKITLQQFREISPFQLQAIPWSKEGFYYEDGERPGKHAFYNAGLYYIQEPSAMAPIELLNVKKGDKVLDLCAAPGGKSTQIAAKLEQTGVLVVNDNHAERIRPLVKNLELFGVRNAVVLNELPIRLERVFADYFDKILVDAPCSGEGMFRKEEEMAKQWDVHSAEKYAVMQRDILKSAAQMLSRGGRLVYSTCTFSTEENEAIIAQFIAESPDFAVVPIEAEFGFSLSIDGTARLWPHLIKGEGHYVAVLERKGEKREKAALHIPDHKLDTNLVKNAARPQEIDLTPYRQFCQEHLNIEMPGVEKLHGEHLYLMPPGLPSLDGIKVIKPGWYIGSIRKNRFEPAHALAMGLRTDEYVRVLHIISEGDEAIRYLKGETLIMDEHRIERKQADLPIKGYCLVCVDGFPVGWGKWQEGMFKNEYPAGWRWMS